MKRWIFPPAPRPPNLPAACAATLALAGFAVAAGAGIAVGREAGEIALRSAIAGLGSAALGAILGWIAARVIASGRRAEEEAPVEPDRDAGRKEEEAAAADAGSGSKRKVE